MLGEKKKKTEKAENQRKFSKQRPDLVQGENN
jgi:hypothetical protein